MAVGHRTPRAAGWSRPGTDDGEGRSHGSRVITFSNENFSSQWISPLGGEGLTAYSCGHSAGFPPASLFTAFRGAAPTLLRAWAPLADLSIEASKARSRLCLPQRLVGTSQIHGRSTR
jgi:hypothetical protein